MCFLFAQKFFKSAINLNKELELIENVYKLTAFERMCFLNLQAKVSNANFRLLKSQIIENKKGEYTLTIVNKLELNLI